MQYLSLSEALFTTTQQKVLGRLFGKPDRSFYANEIARWAQVGKGSLMRELDREDWAAKLAAENSFVVRVAQQEKINLMGENPDQLFAQVQERMAGF